MRAIWIWAAALGIYAVFYAWYGGMGRPLTPVEIDAAMARFEADPEVDPARIAALRTFLEADDGDEFFMVNLLRLQPEPVEEPGSGARLPAARVLGRYTDTFMPRLFARAGHPAFLARAAGAALEQWGVASDPDWSLAGVIRYRSRRDLMQLATAPGFEHAHAYKVASLASTVAFPATPALFFVGPRVWVALSLGLLAACAHLALLQRRLRLV